VGRSVLFFGSIGLALGLRACVVEPVRVNDDAMSPKYREGDVLYINKLTYGLRVPGSGAILWDWVSPQRGDVVVVASVGDPPRTILRKISAREGDKFPKGQELDFVLRPNEFGLGAEQEEFDQDARKLGPIPRRTILGTPLWVWRKNSAAPAR
jgi:signal peptidase I